MSRSQFLFFTVRKTCDSVAISLQGGILDNSISACYDEKRPNLMTHIAEKLSQRDLASLSEQLAIVRQLRDHPGRTISNCVDRSRCRRSSKEGLSR